MQKDKKEIRKKNPNSPSLRSNVKAESMHNMHHSILTKRYTHVLFATKFNIHFMTALNFFDS